MKPNNYTHIQLEAMGWETRGGGPEGIYYTHPYVNGEFLLSQLPDFPELSHQTAVEINRCLELQHAFQDAREGMEPNEI